MTGEFFLPHHAPRDNVSVTWESTRTDIATVEGDGSEMYTVRVNPPLRTTAVAFIPTLTRGSETKRVVDFPLTVLIKGTLKDFREIVAGLRFDIYKDQNCTDPFTEAERQSLKNQTIYLPKTAQTDDGEVSVTWIIQPNNGTVQNLRRAGGCYSAQVGQEQNDQVVNLTPKVSRDVDDTPEEEYGTPLEIIVSGRVNSPEFRANKAAVEAAAGSLRLFKFNREDLVQEEPHTEEVEGASQYVLASSWRNTEDGRVGFVRGEYFDLALPLAAAGNVQVDWAITSAEGTNSSIEDALAGYKKLKPLAGMPLVHAGRTYDFPIILTATLSKGEDADLRFTKTHQVRVVLRLTKLDFFEARDAEIARKLQNLLTPENGNPSYSILFNERHYPVEWVSHPDRAEEGKLSTDEEGTLRDSFTIRWESSDDTVAFITGFQERHKDGVNNTGQGYSRDYARRTRRLYDTYHGASVANFVGHTEEKRVTLRAYVQSDEFEHGPFEYSYTLQGRAEDRLSERSKNMRLLMPARESYDLETELTYTDGSQIDNLQALVGKEVKLPRNYTHEGENIDIKWYVNGNKAHLIDGGEYYYFNTASHRKGADIQLTAVFSRGGFMLDHSYAELRKTWTLKRAP